MKKSTILILFSLVLLISCTNENIYYIDAENGNDANTGHSPESAWASLEKITYNTSVAFRIE